MHPRVHFQCLPVIVSKSVHIHPVFRTCVRTCQLGSFLWKYYDVTGCRTAFGRKIRFGKYSLCDFSDSAGNGCDQFHIFPHVQLLGASGVVFAFILLASLTSIEEEKIPLTFILVALIYIGQQVYDGIFIRDNVSNLTHILGGIVGSGLGYVMNKNKMNRY